MATLIAPRDQQPVLIDEVSWELYDHVLRDLGHGATRMVYDNGRLEIMTVSPKHELIKTAAARLLEYCAVEYDWNLSGLGNVTLRRRDLLIGLEPDECYYIVTPFPSAEAGELDLFKNPPPDLAIEVEVSKTSVDKISIYARLGVREIWRWSGDHFIVLERQTDGNYAQISQSKLLPAMNLAMLAELTLIAVRDGQPAALRQLRDRIRKP